MIIEQKIIKCDICGEEIHEGDHYDYIHMPCPLYDLSCYVHYRTKELSFIHRKEVCIRCLRRISEAMESVCEKYGHYAYAGDYVKFKERVEGESEGNEG